MEWLNQQQCIISQFWKPDVKNQGVGRAMLSRKVLEKHLFQVSLLPSGSSLVVTQSLHGIPPVYLSMSKLSLFIKLPGVLDSEPCL